MASFMTKPGITIPYQKKREQKGGKGRKSNSSMDSNPRSATCELCDPRPVTYLSVAQLLHQNSPCGFGLRFQEEDIGQVLGLAFAK